MPVAVSAIHADTNGRMALSLIVTTRIVRRQVPWHTQGPSGDVVGTKTSHLGRLFVGDNSGP